MHLVHSDDSGVGILRHRTILFVFVHDRGKAVAERADFGGLIKKFLDIALVASLDQQGSREKE